MNTPLASIYEDCKLESILQCEYNIENDEYINLIPPKNMVISINDIIAFEAFLKTKKNKDIVCKVIYDEVNLESLELDKEIINDWDRIISHLTKNKPMIGALLEDSAPNFCGSKIGVDLAIKGSKFLYQNSSNLMIQNFLKNKYSLNCNIEFLDQNNEERCNKIEDEIKKEEENICNLMSIQIEERKKEEENRANQDEIKGADNSKDKSKNKSKKSGENKSTAKSETSAGNVKTFSGNNDWKSYYKDKAKKEEINIEEQRKIDPLYIFGKTQMPKKDYTDIKELTEESGNVKLQGKIISVNQIEIKDKRQLFTINIYDGTYSMYVKAFVEKNDAKLVKGLLKSAKKIEVYGKVIKDKYTDGLTMFVNSIFEKGDEKVVEENKEVIEEEKGKEKSRVELTAHSQMSMLKGLMSIGDIISFAKKNNMKAIGLTDTYNAHAFPDLMYAAKDAGIKPIYGIKGSVVNDSTSPLSFSKNQDIKKSTYCLLDIETTGLSFRTDNITEIGILKFKDGKNIGEFETFINPEKPIPEKIVKITGITNEMVKDAPTIQEIIPKMLDFIGEDSILVAHNANFDIGFLKYYIELNGRKMENTYIDTLMLAKMLYPELKRYKLGKIAEYLGIVVEVAHRALDDVKTMTKVFIDMLERLQGMDINKWDEVDTKIKQDEEAFKKITPYDTTILVRTQSGLKQLYFLISDSHVNHFFREPRILKSLLAKNRDGLFIGSGNEKSELFSGILSGKSDEELEDIAEFYDFLEIQPIGNHEYLLQKKIVGSKEDIENINKKIIDIGKKLGKTVVVTGDTYFLNPEDKMFVEMLDISKKLKEHDIQPDTHFRTTKELLDEFSKYLGEDVAYEIVVENSNAIANKIDMIKPISDLKCTPEIEDGDNKLRDMCYNKAKRLYGDPLPERIQKRLDKELTSIISNGYSALYLLAQMLVQKSNNDGYVVGSRGSVGSSLVAYMADITEVNSLESHYRCPKCKHSEFIENVLCGIDLPDKNCPKCGSKYDKDGMDIPFETFLGFEGNKEPDIDLNFSSEYQSIIHRYVNKIIGGGTTFKAGTIGSIQERTAYGYVLGYYEKKGLPLPAPAEIERLSLKLVGTKRTTGQHPGGIIVCPEGHSILEFTPIQKPADKADSDIITTHFDYHKIEKNLLKLDLLGQEDPTTIKMLKDITGLDPVNVPLDDSDTMKIFSSTETLGVTQDDIHSPVGSFGIPEFGTLFVRGMLEDTKPTTFDELIRISGLSHGTDVWLNNAQELVHSGVINLKQAICTRDDIMTFLISQGVDNRDAFNIMEKVRKGKGLSPEHEQILVDAKIPDWYIDSCKKIKYMFPKAHAAAYVTLAFRIAWFKVHKPAAFYTTYFSIMNDVFDSTYMLKGKKYIKEKIVEAKKNFKKSKTDERLYYLLEVVNEFYERGLKFADIDLYQSEALKFKCVDEKTVRPPISSLPGIGEKAAHSIVKAAKEKPFETKEDLKARAKIGDSVLEILDNMEITKGLPDSMQISLFDM